MTVKAEPAAVAPAASAAQHKLAYLLLGFTMLVWGGSFVAARSLLAPTEPGATILSPTVLAALRFVLASLLFVPPLLARRLRRAPSAPARTLSRGDLLRLLGLGQLGIAAYFWLQYTGVRLTNAGIASILVVGLIPIATALVARRQLGEPLRPAQAAALGLGLLGVAVVVVTRGGGLDLAMSGSFAFGALCLVADAALFAIYSTLVRDLRTRFDALTLTAGTTAAGALGLVLLAVATGGWRSIGSLAGWQWLAVIYLSLVCSVLAYFAYNRALSMIEAGRASTWVYLEPPVALIFGALLLGETITPGSIAGGLIIGLAVWYVSRSR